jgi:tetratricopeptide (TPR) repeat protein
LKTRPVAAATAVLFAFLVLGTTFFAGQPATSGGVPAEHLAPTAHPAVPAHLDALWYAPAQDVKIPPAVADFVKGVTILDQNGDAAAALPLVAQPALASTGLADYAEFYRGKALLTLGRSADAEAAFAAVAGKTMDGHLPEDAALGQAQAREARLDFNGAVSIYQKLLARKLAAPHVALSRMAIAAERGLDLPRAIDALRRVYYEYPLSSESTLAEASLTRLNAWDEDDPQTALELKRADVLFQARRWSSARASYERAEPGVTGDQRDRVQTRMLACDVQLKRYRQASTLLKGQLAGAAADEAAFYFITTLRGLGERDEYVRQARIFADSRPSSPFAEEALNNLATHFIVADEDLRADDVYRTMIER